MLTLRVIQRRLNETINDMWGVFGKLLSRGKTLNELEHDSEHIAQSSTHFLNEMKIPTRRRQWTVNWIWCYCCDRNKIHKHKIRKGRVVEI
jgi:hypothetical protein